jgi:hypothetical protein
MLRGLRPVQRVERVALKNDIIRFVATINVSLKCVWDMFTRSGCASGLL